jgi:hypothetical protein
MKKFKVRTRQGRYYNRIRYLVIENQECKLFPCNEELPCTYLIKYFLKGRLASHSCGEIL